MPEPLDEAAERLYGLPLEAFTPTRDALAKELRREKQRDVATAVGRLPKPTAAAWAANRLVRERRELVDALLEAGTALRAAQDEAVAGGGATALRDAAAAERTAVDALLAAARELQPGGRRATATVLDRLRATLHAAAADDDVRTALAAGRLTADAQGGAAWGLLSASPAPQDDPKPAGTARRPRRPAAERAGRKAQQAERRARSERELADARGDVRAGEERLRKAERAADAAHGALREREEGLAGAEREAAAAAERLAAAQEALEAARPGAVAARKALDAARHAVEAARERAGRLERELG